MDPILRQKITEKLCAFLNREPKEHEIINGQNDSTLMQWIAADDTAQQNAAIAHIAAQTNVDIAEIAPDIGAKINL